MSLAKKLDPNMILHSYFVYVCVILKPGNNLSRLRGLFGVAEHVGGGLSQYPLNLLEQSWRETALSDLKSSLGEQRMADLRAEGQTMNLDAAITLALE